VKDPGQRDSSPYEVLGVAPGASAEEIDRAFKEGLLKRLNVQKLTAAKQTLAQPEQRAMADLFLYKPEVLQRLQPNPLQDASALLPPRRFRTAEEWESSLKARFPDLGLVHSLAVLWYWSGAPNGESDEGARGQEPAPRYVWERAIACWAMLVTSDDFWEPFALQIRQTLKTRVVETIRAKLQDLEQPYRDRGDHAAAQIYQDLELSLDTELNTARRLASAGLRSTGGIMTCGPMMLDQMGILSVVRTQIQMVIDRAPENPALRTLRDALSPYASIAELIRKLDPKSALEALARLPAAERESREVRGIVAEAHRVLAKQQASLDRLDEALGSWAEALKAAPDIEPLLRPDVESFCQARAAALQRSDPAQAIGLLERATSLVDSEKLRLTLAELLTQRGIDTINDAQSKADQEKKPAPLDAMERGLRDLERAASLGSERGATNADVARKMLIQARWSSKKARTVDFNDLPAAVRRRFVDATHTKGPPYPFLSEMPASSQAALIGLAVIGFIAYVLQAWIGFGEMGPRMYQGVGGLVSGALCLSLVGFGAMAALKEKLTKKSYPYRQGTYIFPLEYVDARNRILRIIPLRDVKTFDGVHHRNQGGYSHTNFTFGFTDESSQPLTARFRVNKEAVASEAMRQLQDYRQREKDALASGDVQAIQAMSLFADV
jgi:hypothetical protein